MFDKDTLSNLLVSFSLFSIGRGEFKDFKDSKETVLIKEKQRKYVKTVNVKKRNGL